MLILEDIPAVKMQGQTFLVDGYHTAFLAGSVIHDRPLIFGDQSEYRAPRLDCITRHEDIRPQTLFRGGYLLHEVEVCHVFCAVHQHS